MAWGQVASVLGSGIDGNAGKFIGFTGNLLDAYQTDQDREEAIKRYQQAQALQEYLVSQQVGMAREAMARDNAIQDNILGQTDNLGQVLADVLNQIGPYQQGLDANQYNDEFNFLNDTYTNQINDAFDRANSETYGNVLYKLGDSRTAERDRQRDLVTKYAPLYQQATAKARENALSNISAYNDEIFQNRERLFGEYKDVLGSPLEYQLKAYSTGSTAPNLSSAITGSQNLASNAESRATDSTQGFASAIEKLSENSGWIKNLWDKKSGSGNGTYYVNSPTQIAGMFPEE